MVRKWSTRSCAAPALTNPLVISGLQQYGSRADDQLLQPAAVLLRTLVIPLRLALRAELIHFNLIIEQLRMEMSEVPDSAHFAFVGRSCHYSRLGKIFTFCNHQGCLPVIRCRSAQLLTIQVLVALGHGVG